MEIINRAEKVLVGMSGAAARTGRCNEKKQKEIYSKKIIEIVVTYNRTEITENSYYQYINIEGASRKYRKWKIIQIAVYFLKKGIKNLSGAAARTLMERKKERIKYRKKKGILAVRKTENQNTRDNMNDYKYIESNHK